MFWLFKKRKIEHKVNKLHKSVSDSFFHIKEDMRHIGNWISHFNYKHDRHEDEIEKLKIRLGELEDHIVDLKNLNIKQQEVQFKKQTVLEGLDDIYSEKGADFFKNLTVMERAILWILLNTDLKMRYDDLCVVLGKNKSTIRGQINNIRNKTELVKEINENDGTKRFFIEEKMKNEILKKINKIIRNKPIEEKIKTQIFKKKDKD